MSTARNSVPAVGLTRFGGPEVLGLVEIPLLEPVGSNVRVTVKAAAVNPIDSFFRQGFLTGGELPAHGPLVPGMDFAGVVSAAGDSADWQVGDEVIGTTTPSLDPTRGAYASEVITADDALVRQPRGSTPAEASTLLMNGLTALYAVDQVPLSPGGVLAVTGGAGVIGGYAIGLAQARGWRVVADAASHDADLVSSLGADVVVERGEGVEQRLVEAAGGPLAAVLDVATIGPSLLSAVAPGGRLVSFRPRDWKADGGATVVDVHGSAYFHDRAKLQQLHDLVEDGSLRLRVAGTFSAEQATAAHTALDRGGSRGRLVLTWP